jgi:putative addiction module killer protein
MKIKIEQYIKENGISPFEKWFNKLNAIAAAKISRVLYRMESGNFSNVESLGDGIFENKIHFGPGYRIYFGQEGDELVILLGGGTKKQQSKDIHDAKALWAEYKKAKKR